MERPGRPSGGEKLEVAVAADARLAVIPGTIPLVLVAPHGGRRDPVRRPWGASPLKMNDLHTAALTAELAAATGAAAIINAERDRNDVDLNRISDAHAGAPAFLERLAELLDGTIARHGRATVVAIHGWNVIQPVVDLGLGCAPGDDPFAVGDRAAVSPRFAAGALRALVAACATRGIDATVGARYPARHRENLVQLFTTRYRDDPRAVVRALATLGARVDAVQMELGIVLRWPGPWRRRLVAACRDVLPALVAPTPEAVAASAIPAPRPIVPRRLQFVAPRLSGLVALDAGRGGRLLLFPPGGGLFLFTGERLGLGRSRGLDVGADPNGVLHVRFAGPLLRFPDTRPFLDLEVGLAAADLVEAEVALDFTPAHAADGSGEFGRVTGTVTVDGSEDAIAGDAFAEDGPAAGPWPRFRAAVRVDETSLALTIPLDGGAATGFVCRDGRHVAVASARAVFGSADAPLDRVDVDVRLADGGRHALSLQAVHRLPVVRARGASPVRIEFAACRHATGRPHPAGWCEFGGS